VIEVPEDAQNLSTFSEELQVRELAMLVKKLSLALRKSNPDATLPNKALDYLHQNNLMGSPLR
jgi:hypothetical protein